MAYWNEDAEERDADDVKGDRQFLLECLKAPEPDLRLAATKALIAEVSLIKGATDDELIERRDMLKLEVEELEEERDKVKGELAELLKAAADARKDKTDDDHRNGKGARKDAQHAPGGSDPGNGRPVARRKSHGAAPQARSQGVFAGPVGDGST